jgi:adenylate cyclase
MRVMDEGPREEKLSPYGLPMDEDLRRVLTGEHPAMTKMRNRMRHVPSSPRCKMCWAPFEGLGGAVLRHFGFAKFSGNPSICTFCLKGFHENGVTGAEIPVTLLFADIRGSTGLGERLTPKEFHAFLNHFYRLALEAVMAHDGLLDKFVGDEVVALFFGGVTGPAHAEAGIAAAELLLERCARPDATPMGPIPVGAGVHTGEAYVGTSGPVGSAVDDFTALGDPVNTAARLASSAKAGELLVSADAAAAAGRAFEGHERRTIEIRGRQGLLDVVVLEPAAVAA